MSLIEPWLLWWLAPLSGAAGHVVPEHVSTHARLMVAAWGVLLPLGALAARYFKVPNARRWPQTLDSKPWWHAHRALQWLGLVLMVCGVWMVTGRSSSAVAGAQWHGWLGWLVCALGGLQGLGGVFRGSKGGPTDVQLRGDHYDMTPRRRAFERTHKALGWVSVLLAVVVIVLGLWLADAPRWMPLALGAWWCLLTAVAVRWQRQGRCVDTYQAIWGPDPRHPGNASVPIGWGVRRLQPTRASSAHPTHPAHHNPVRSTVSSRSIHHGP
jgi:hypothetical protein